jgi:hypothetical protein
VLVSLWLWEAQWWVLECMVPLVYSTGHEHTDMSEEQGSSPELEVDNRPDLPVRH